MLLLHRELVWQVYHVSWPSGEKGGTLLLFLVKSWMNVKDISSMRKKNTAYTDMNAPLSAYC